MSKADPEILTSQADPRILIRQLDPVNTSTKAKSSS